jgi:preprotein translocase subunit SecF
MQIIQKRKIFFSISGFLVGTSLLFLALWGLKPGIDFTDGVLMELKFSQKTPSSDEIKKSLEGIDLGSVVVQPSEENSILLRFVSKSDDLNQQVQDKLKASFSDISFERIEFTTTSQESKTKAAEAVFLATFGIAIYIAWAFKKISRPVESWKYGIAAIVALLHDTIITLGAFAFLGKYYGIEVGVPFVAALLTILGYSVNDTIVVFDRIRENLLKSGAKENFEETVNNSVNETLARSINTSMTVLLVLVAIFFFGGLSIKYFALALIIGVFFGTYSSIYIASALLVEAWRYFRRA